jgi:hypothetical protein
MKFIYFFSTELTVEAILGSSALLEAKVLANPAPTFTWSIVFPGKKPLLPGPKRSRLQIFEKNSAKLEKIQHF